MSEKFAEDAQKMVHIPYDFVRAEMVSGEELLS
jgi:hypothetical protein